MIVLKSPYPESSYSIESEAFFARLATQPTDARKIAYDHLISDLVNSGTWSRLDTLYLASANDSPTARTNLISGNYYLSPYGSPTFGLDHSGYQGTNSLSDFLDNDFNLALSSGNYSQDSASMGVFLTAGPASGADSGEAMGLPAGNLAEIYPHYTDNKFYWIANGSAEQVGAATTSTGLFSWSRTASNADVAYRNGVQYATATDASHSLLNSTITILQANGAPAKTSMKIGAAFSGGALTAADHLALYNALNTYLTAVNGQSGTADPIALSGAAVTIVNDGKFNSVPGFAKLDNGNLIAIYNSATDDSLADGVWKYKISTDGGAMWSAATTLYTAPAGFAADDVEVVRLADGTLLVTGMSQNATTPAQDRLVTIRGAADASTWETPVLTQASIFSGHGTYTTSKAVEISPNNLILPIYGIVSGDSKFSAGAIFSTDGGASWGASVVVARATSTEQYTEANFILINSQIVAIIRHDLGDVGYARSFSTDSGAMWSSPVNVIPKGLMPEPGKPALLKLGSRIFMWGRFGGRTSSRWGWSNDGGKVWTPFIAYGTQGQEYFYASSDILSGSTFGSILSRRVNSTNAYIVYQGFTY